MPAAPNIWIWRAKAPTMPDWLQERIVGGIIRSDGTFDLEASDGQIGVGHGDAVFEIDGQVYACPPRDVQAKLAAIAGDDNPSAADVEPRPAVAKRAVKTPAGDRPLKLKPMIGTPPAPQFIRVADLEVDDTYQRSIEAGTSQKLITTIAENWDWRLCLPLLVSRRAGRMFVIDGQHRKEAADLRGDIHSLPCVLFDFDDPRAEAELFIQANRSRRQMGKLDDFHAAVVAGDAKALAINEVVTASGLAVGRQQAWQYWKPGEIVFVASIQRLMHSQGKEAVSRALSMIALAFEGEVMIGAGAIFEGLTAFAQQRLRDKKPIEDELMVSVLGAAGLAGWKEAVEGAETAGERADAMQRAIESAYEEAEAQ